MNRSMAFIYGAVAYALFFAAFLYLIGFTGNLMVPKSIDSGASAPPAEALLVNLGLIALFGVQHSVMARPGFKKRWTRIVPKPVERSTFVLITSLILLLMFWQWRPVTAVVWEVESGVGRVLLWALFWLGWGLVLLSTFLINHFDLFGLRQVYLHLKGEAYEHLRFKATSLYRFVRHPLLLGFLIAFWSTPKMTVGHLVYAAGWTIYILIAIPIEERDLIRFHGAAYQDYRSKVPGLVPFSRGKGGYAPAPEAGVREEPDLT